MTLKIKQNFEDKAIFKIWLEAARKELHEQGKRVNRQRFQPLANRFSAKNRPNVLTKSERPNLGARTTITAHDAEENKPLFKWLHITGTKPHPIFATKPHGLLVFEIGGRTIFTKKPVNHPGFKSSGEVERIQKDEYPKIEKAVRKAGIDAARSA